MIGRFSILLLEVAALGLAIASVVFATTSQSTIDTAIAGMAALVAAQLHALASSQARGRRFDAAVSRRPAPPANDHGGM